MPIIRPITRSTWDDLGTDLGTVRFSVNSNVRFNVGPVTPAPVRPTVNRWGDPVSAWCIDNNCPYCFTTPDNARIDMTIDNPLDEMSGVDEDRSILSGNDDDDCPACRLKNGNSRAIVRGTIHPYHSEMDGGWQLRRVQNDRYGYYLGVELETDTDYDTPSMILERAASMRRPLDHWHAKHDGSVGGPEFASNPATLTWWQRHKIQVSEMFKLLLHAGLRSYDGGKAGMHVNISRTAFDDPGHLYRFAHLIHIKPSWSTILSQRTADQVQQWSRFTAIGRSISDWKRWADDHYLNSGSPSEKYAVLNAPYGPRIEFRLPRGTLRIDRFMKNLEWTTSMVEYTRNADNDPHPFPFMESVIQTPGRYPNLYGFMNERSKFLLTASK